MAQVEPPKQWVVVVSVAVVAVGLVVAAWWPREPGPAVDDGRTERCRTLNLQTARKIEADGTCSALVGEAHARCSITAAAAMHRELRDCHRCSGPSVTDCPLLEP